MSHKKQKHEDTATKLDMTIEEALKKAVDAGPYPKKPRKTSMRSAPDTSPADRQPDQAKQ